MSGESPKIGTHSGTFHADEALAIWMLKKLPYYSAATVIRTRDPERLKDCDIVVDVGGVYDHKQKRYDHHQRGFDTNLNEGGHDTIKLSSAGLIYKHYGRELIRILTARMDLTNQEKELVFFKLYESFIASIDANDNGIDNWEHAEDATPVYVVQTDASSRVRDLNPAWNAGHCNMDALFQEAVKLMGEEFFRIFERIVRSWLPARHIVQKAYDARRSVHPSGQIMVIGKYCPYGSHLFAIEDGSVEPSVLYIIWWDNRSGDWKVRAASKTLGSYALKKPLKEAWTGRSGSDLCSIAGKEDLVFCHSSGFIGGAKTEELAVWMAVQSLES